MHARPVLAADADARAVDLGEAVDVEEVDVEAVLDALTGLGTPALGADDAVLEAELVLETALLDLLGEKQGV